MSLKVFIFPIIKHNMNIMEHKFAKDSQKSEYCF